MNPLLQIRLPGEFWKCPANCCVYIIERLSRCFSAAHEIRRVKFHHKGQTNFECSYITSMVLLLLLFFVKEPTEVAFTVSVVAQLTDNDCRPNLAVLPKNPNNVIDLRLKIVSFVWLEFQCLRFHKFDPLFLLILSRPDFSLLFFDRLLFLRLGIVFSSLSKFSTSLNCLVLGNFNLQVELISAFASEFWFFAWGLVFCVAFPPSSFGFSTIFSSWSLWFCWVCAVIFNTTSESFGWILHWACLTFVWCRTGATAA